MDTEILAGVALPEETYIFVVYVRGVAAGNPIYPDGRGILVTSSHATVVQNLTLIVLTPLLFVVFVHGDGHILPLSSIKAKNPVFVNCCPTASAPLYVTFIPFIGTLLEEELELELEYVTSV